MKKSLLFSILLVVLLALSGCGSSLMKIDSPVGTLEYPSQWKKYLKTESDETSVKFSAELKGKSSQHLFTLFFGTNEGYPLGTLDGIAISIVDGDLMFDDTWSEEERKIVSNMSSDVNVILDKLHLLDISDSPEASQEPEVNIELAYVSTPIGELAYSNEYADQVVCIPDGNILSFFGKADNGENVLLFKYGFNEELEYFVGTVGETEIYFEVNDISAERFSEAEIKRLDSQINMVNDLLDSISAYEGFISA